LNAIDFMDEARTTVATLAEECRSGRLDAFERLYRLQGGRMKSVAYHLLGSIPDAEDAVQEAFLRIYKGAGGFRNEAGFIAWVYRILVNTCHDLRRRKQRRPESAPEDRAGNRENTPLALALAQALARLDERRRMVFLLFEAEGFAHTEIAAILQITEGNSRYLLHQAKRELQEMLG
jgi:RNA polymerase sigma-70 factor, ECF subfamily